MKPDPRAKMAARDLPVHAIAAPPVGGEKAPPLWRRWVPPAPRVDHRTTSAADTCGPSSRGCAAWVHGALSHRERVEGGPEKEMESGGRTG